MNQKPIKLLTLFALLLLPVISWGLESDSKQPINIEADEALMNDKKGVTEYKGQAVLTQGSLKIEGDVITFYFDGDKNITKAVSVGNLASYKQIQQQGKGAVKARGTRLEYYPKSKTIIVVGQAHVTQGGDTFSGPRIKYDIGKNIVYAGQGAASGNTGKPAKTGGRVRVVIQPAGGTSSAPVSTPTPPQAEYIGDATGLTGFATTRLNVRTEPDVDSAKVGSLPPHGQFTVVSQSEDWLQIQMGNNSGGGLIGWVSRRYVKLNN